MSLKATIFKATLQIADMNRHYYNDNLLTIARHPSENDERMMVRLLAFALHASDSLSFANGITENDEADIWEKDLTGAIKIWIDVGLPDEKLIRKACGRAEQVYVYCYGGRVAELWWEKAKSKLEPIKNLSIINLPLPATQEMALLAKRGMKLNYTVQDADVTIGDESSSVEVSLISFKK